jgi:hypothetical protein
MGTERRYPGGGETRKRDMSTSKRHRRRRACRKHRCRRRRENKESLRGRGSKRRILDHGIGAGTAHEAVPDVERRGDESF